MRSIGRVVAATVVAGLLAACDGGKDGKTPTAVDAADRPVALVGERVITLGDLNREIKNYRSMLGGESDVGAADQLTRLRQGLLNRLVNRVVLETEAEAEGVTVSQDDLDNEIRDLLGEYDEARLNLILAENALTFDEWKAGLAQLIKIRKLTVRRIDNRIALADKELRDYYRENAEDFKWPERARALQIMTEDETTAEQVRRKLVQGGDFPEQARKFSQSPDASAGGDLGFFSRGQLPPEFESAVFSLKEGEISQVIKSIYGFHLFKLISKEKSRAMTFEESRDRVRAILTARKREEEFTQWVESLKEKYEVTIYPESLSAPSSSSR